jgi:PAS domain S-box-containing protein
LEKILEERSIALNTAEEQIKTLFENAQVGIGITGLEGKILSVNQALLDMTGYEESEILDTNISNLYLEPEQRSRLKEQLQVLGEVHDFGIKLLRKDGTFFYASLNVSKLIRDGREIILALIEDVTESEARFRATFEQAAVGIAHVGPDGSFLRLNQRFCDIVGYSHDEMLAQTFQDITHPDDLDADLEYVRQMLAGEIETYDMEKRYFRKSGEIVWVNLTVSLVRRATGEPDYFVSVVEDITERKRAVGALQESEARFRATFEQAAVGIDHEAPGGRFLRINQKLCDIVGYSREEMLERTYQDITHPDDLDIDHENAQRMLDGQLESYSIEKRYLRKNGEIVWVNITVSLVREDKGGPSYFISVVEDITERKQAVEALQKSEKRFKDVAGNASEWIWEVDSNGKYTREFANRNVHKNGKVVWLLTSGLPIIDERGELLGYRGADTDITARKQVEQALRDTEEQYRTLDLEPLLELTLDHLSRIVDYDSAFIRIREGDSLVVRADRGSVGAPSLVGMLVSTEASPMFRQIMETREAFFVDDISKHSDLVQGVVPDTELLSETAFSWLGVPVVAKNQVIGVISLVYNPSGYYSDTVVEHTQALANRAAIAIQNARLHEQVQQAAALTERQRLARELHDAVSQTLFAAGMIADATPRLWDKDPASGQQNLELLSAMIRGASAEMRSLLLELRPDTLKGQTLGSLLQTLAIAARARTQAAVSLKVEGDCQGQEDVTLAFHRIAQETLNNIAKHAEASQVVIDCSCDPESTKLCIQDDGRGFDPQAIQAGHLGIGIMYERARKIGADIKIDSEIGRGTQVSVSWSAAGKESTSGDKTEHE